MNELKILPEGYEIRTLNDEDFSVLWDKHAPQIFDDNSQIFRSWQHLSTEEKKKLEVLSQAFGKPYRLNLGVFHKGEFVGWSAGHQESTETYYMRNSAILPEHRQKGLYTALLSQTITQLTEMGFQKIYSRHSATNNDVIIPKLKFGFQISSLEVSDTFGVLVHLVYFPKELRRKMLVYRVGDMKPDEEIRKVLNI